MGCDECREAVSAELDGEDLPGEAAMIADHLEGCAQCREFAERATYVTRLTRTRAAEPVPDLVAAVTSAAVVAAAPPPRRLLGSGAVRVALGVVGVAQFALAVVEMVGTDAGAQHGAVLRGAVEVGGASMTHLANESSAWNVAVAVGFLWAALGSSRVVGLVPVVGAFVGVLTVLSVLDVVGGRVDADRLLSHGPLVLGFVLLLLLPRVARGGGGAGVAGSPGARRTGDRSVFPFPRRLDGGDGLQPTAHHRAA